MNALLEIVLSNVVAASTLALCVAAFSRVCRRPAVIHSLWVLVLLKFVTPPIIALPIPVDWLQTNTLTPTAAAISTGVETIDSLSTESAATEVAAPAEQEWPTALFVDDPFDTEPFDTVELTGETAGMPADEVAVMEPIDGALESAMEQSPVVAPVPDVDQETLTVAAGSVSPTTAILFPTKPTTSPAEGPATLGASTTASTRLGWTGMLPYLLIVWLAGTLFVFLRAAVKIVQFDRRLKSADCAPNWLQEECNRLAK